MDARLLQPLARPFDLRLELPGSKSFANRALVCAALSGAPCTLRNLSGGDDVALMLNLLVDLGWQVKRSGRADVALLPPKRLPALPHEQRIYTGAAGTTTRFAAALLAVTPGRFLLDGNARMRERPMAELVGALRELGAVIQERGKPGCLPLYIEGGSLKGGTCTLPGTVSSQFLSALLLVAPARGLEIRIAGELVSKPYVEMTLQVMQAFGVGPACVRRDSYRSFTVTVAAYRGADYTCPPDGTAAGYFWAAAAVTGSLCVVNGLVQGDAQSDAQLAGLLAQMGCRLAAYPDGLGVDGRGARLRGIRADLSALPDSAQTLAVAAAFARGTTRLEGLGTLRVKETDRIAALQAELAKLGVATRAGPDWLEVDGNPDQGPDAAPVDIATYEDHRMAMSFAIAGLRRPVRVEEPAVVAKSFPEFWEYWQRLYRGA
ncbi:MAG: 3-phosphoshikimate 1-carboxyvinyltransferase [Planctomycetes bacterium]|nr:3-phosphoshikimate 1-carboxyvinyltransferase [Planctomycetota bacterium]